jgi:hypothetical protein
MSFFVRMTFLNILPLRMMSPEQPKLAESQHFSTLNQTMSALLVLCTELSIGHQHAQLGGAPMSKLRPDACQI